MEICFLCCLTTWLDVIPGYVCVFLSSYPFPTVEAISFLTHFSARLWLALLVAVFHINSTASFFTFQTQNYKTLSSNISSPNSFLFKANPYLLISFKKSSSTSLGYPQSACTSPLFSPILSIITKTPSLLSN